MNMSSVNKDNYTTQKPSKYPVSKFYSIMAIHDHSALSSSNRGQFPYSSRRINFLTLNLASCNINTGSSIQHTQCVNTGGLKGIEG